MRMQSTIVRLGAVVVLATLTVGSALAEGPGRLQHPRQLSEPGFRVMSPWTNVMPLGIGTPNSLAFIEAWTTSDQVPDDFSTYPYWFDDEVLSIFLAFFTAKTTNIVITVQIKDASGATVFTATDEGSFDPQSLVGGTISVGTLASGPYKVFVKVKQGTKVVGQQYWLLVYPPPPLPN